MRALASHMLSSPEYICIQTLPLYSTLYKLNPQSSPHKYPKLRQVGASTLTFCGICLTITATDMKLLTLLTTLLAAATTAVASRASDNRRNCKSEEDCFDKCAHGEFHRFKNKAGQEQMRCNGTHWDYRWATMVCTQTLGLSNRLTKKYCPRVNGTVCFANDWQPTKCLAEVEMLPMFKKLCKENGVRRWGAKIEDNVLPQICPHEMKKGSNKTLHY